MAYIQGDNRSQITLLPQSVDEYIDEENPVRLIDAFVDSLDMGECGFTRIKPAYTGAPGYDPRDLLKLYLYAYFNKIRSSRKIAKEATRNVEVMWLIGKLTPDFRTIADFRKDNVKALKATYRAWNVLCDRLGLYGKEYVSIDGSKFKAVNSKDRNFTLSKLDDRLKRIDNHIEEYLALLDSADTQETDERSFTKAEIAEKLKDLQSRKDTFEGYLHELETTGEKQKSLTDSEARLMKFHEGFDVGYNVQTAIDSQSHMIAGFLVTDHATDHGLLEDVAKSVKDLFGLETIETVADKGYQDTEDMRACLEQGIIPHVHPNRRGDAHTLVTDHEQKEITDEQRASTEPEDLKACLKAGVIPDLYAGVISDIELIEQRSYQCEFDSTDAQGAEQMIAQAKRGYFVRDSASDKVYCPEGAILRPKSTKKDGTKRYHNRLACKTCKHRCTNSRYKEIDFVPGKTVIGCKGAGAGGTVQKVLKRTVVWKKKVRFKLLPDVRKLDQRMSLSEHPFGTVKHWHDGSYFLLMGKKKVTGELSLSFLIYNMKRAIEMMGVRELIAAMG